MSAAAATSAVAQGAIKAGGKTWLTGVSLALADVIAVVSAAVLSLLLFQLGHSPWGIVLKQFLPGLATLGAFAVLGLYPVIGLNPALEFQRVILGSSAGYAVVAVVLSLRQTMPFAALARHSAGCALTVVLVFACRALCRGLCSSLPWWGTPVVLFGSGPDARAVFRVLQRQCAGLKVVGVFDDAPIAWPELNQQRTHISTPDCAPEFARSCAVSHAIVATSGLTGTEIGKLMSKHVSRFRHVLVLPGLAASSSVRVELRAIGGMLGLHLTRGLFPLRAQLVKRACDLVLASAAAVVLFPLCALICLAVWLGSRGPVFYGHLRIGQGNSMFKAWKFRTMHPDADEILSACLETNPDLRRQWEQSHKLKSDPRVTSVGRILRKTSLDEIPQLWNVLAGEMSFVGPRPIVAAEVARYGEKFEDYTSVRPGITGLWQVSGRNNTTYEERVELDEYYVRNWSVWLDLYIVSRTVKTVLLGDGAY
jgi:Undecaprenyl-phosphate galactose phosphotransferase WbaP